MTGTAKRNQVIRIMVVFREIDMMRNQFAGTIKRLTAQLTLIIITFSDLTTHHPGKSRRVGQQGFTALPVGSIWAPETWIAGVIRRWHNPLCALSTTKHTISKCSRCAPNRDTASFAGIPVALNLPWFSLPPLPFALARAAAKAVLVLCHLAGLTFKLFAAVLTRGNAPVCALEVNNPIASAQLCATRRATSKMFVRFPLAGMDFHRYTTDRAFDLYTPNLEGIKASFVAELMLVGFYAAGWTFQHLAALITGDLHDGISKTEAPCRFSPQSLSRRHGDQQSANRNNSLFGFGKQTADLTRIASTGGL